ncbi:MAG TPA: histidine kinase [Ideonella sp.]|uniref:sensor histidine kinase n=1 Tax=Ideonella sp. TaxID=1929293 RepID=UPI002BB31F4C|nr:histidine kinase [Ideonella sp.]HSI51957.1 histidine kinase [Ideonella sp.]
MAFAAVPSDARWFDWRCVMMMLPRRRFTMAELARAVPHGPSPSIVGAVLFNVIFVMAMYAVAFHAMVPAPIWFVMGFYLLGLLGGLWALWHDPGCRAGRWAYYVMPMATASGFLLVPMLTHGGSFGQVLHTAQNLSHAPAGPGVLGALFGMGMVGLWFTAMHRSQHIALRLAELDERERALEMARQLGSAQIQPHFLFNTLASLQHWVASSDPRAAPLLDSLTGYLRATLPLFDRPLLRLDQELEAVRRYLEVMQARLGERLRFEIRAEPALGASALPPGLLLTLVENAVEHGISPQLAGGSVQISAWREAGQLCIAIDDDGPGLPLQPGPAEGHVGLVNSRARLAQAFGQRAELSLGNRAEGGCRALLSLPLSA